MAIAEHPVLATVEINLFLNMMISGFLYKNKTAVQFWFPEHQVTVKRSNILKVSLTGNIPSPGYRYLHTLKSPKET